jgi:hypothetical protein
LAMLQLRPEAPSKMSKMVLTMDKSVTVGEANIISSSAYMAFLKQT